MATFRERIQWFSKRVFRSMDREDSDWYPAYWEVFVTFISVRWDDDWGSMIHEGWTDQTDQTVRILALTITSDMPGGMNGWMAQAMAPVTSEGAVESTTGELHTIDLLRMREIVHPCALPK
ncbi:hypothetical protein Z517_09325 [Fonsecaea pedrosoi CBS 271.37]|uniref:Uncharacterized protein n=1 Tax=Fonsecaea pedrosoi CBS 271.37 TaxID=1442368 RepID=A0A0D2DGS3_9EURO|nr:uncharacterized protein Z517_09325 [Fonsecaea pedrosoi CBS 271.37]KIW76881.1 hypothetical protein Z517_09325 [Fonsecaea pedrosoi CBS 271.37]